MFTTLDKKYYVPVHLYLLICCSSTAETSLLLLICILKDQQNSAELSKQNLSVICLRLLQITG